MNDRRRIVLLISVAVLAVGACVARVWTHVNNARTRALVEQAERMDATIRMELDKLSNSVQRLKLTLPDEPTTVKLRLGDGEYATWVERVPEGLLIHTTNYHTP